MDEDQLWLYEQGEIPLYCESCKRYTKSDHYRLTNIKDPIRGWSNAVTGICPHCGELLQKLFPLNRELTNFSNSVAELYKKGRVKDERFTNRKV